MQLRPNYGNVAVACVALFFIYLLYVLFGPGASTGLPDGLSIDIRELANYCILAARAGGHAVRLVHGEKKTAAVIKSLTQEGAKEFVTKADLVSNQIIMDVLFKFPGLKIISEEKTSLPQTDIAAYKQDKRVLWKSSERSLAGLASAFPLSAPPVENIDFNERQKLFLDEITVWVDPLDATQEFTVWGVADEQRPYLYSSTRGQLLPLRSDAASGGSDSKPNAVNKTVLVSRSHAGGKVRSLIDDALGSGVYEIEPAGGAGYKTLRVLNGSAALYLHATRVKKWDLCAGDALASAAGGRALTLDGDQLTYFAADNPVNDRGWLVAIDRPFAYSAKLKPHWLKLGT